jgi:hypothetical protein
MPTPIRAKVAGSGTAGGGVEMLTCLSVVDGADRTTSAVVLEVPVAETVKSVRLEGATKEGVALSKEDWATAESDVASISIDRRGRCFMIMRDLWYDLIIIRLNGFAAALCGDKKGNANADQSEGCGFGSGNRGLGGAGSHFKRRRYIILRSDANVGDVIRNEWSCGVTHLIQGSATL